MLQTLFSTPQCELEHQKVKLYSTLLGNQCINSPTYISGSFATWPLYEPLLILLGESGVQYLVSRLGFRV